MMPGRRGPKSGHKNFHWGAMPVHETWASYISKIEDIIYNSLKCSTGSFIIIDIIELPSLSTT